MDVEAEIFEENSDDGNDHVKKPSNDKEHSSEVVRNLIEMFEQANNNKSTDDRIKSGTIARHFTEHDVQTLQLAHKKELDEIRKSYQMEIRKLKISHDLNLKEINKQVGLVKKNLKKKNNILDQIFNDQQATISEQDDYISCLEDRLAYLDPQTNPSSPEETLERRRVVSFYEGDLKPSSRDISPSMSRRGSFSGVIKKDVITLRRPSRCESLSCIQQLLAKEMRDKGTQPPGIPIMKDDQKGNTKKNKNKKDNKPKEASDVMKLDFRKRIRNFVTKNEDHIKKVFTETIGDSFA